MVLAPLALAPGLVLAAIAAVIVGRAHDRVWPSPPRILVVLVALVVAWALASLLWTVDAAATLAKLPRFVGLALAGLVFVDMARGVQGDRLRICGRLALIGFVLALAVLSIERLADAPLRRLWMGPSASSLDVLNTFNRSMSVIALLVWPAVLASWRRHRLAAAVMWVAALAVVMAFISDAAVVAMVLGAAAFAAVVALPRAAPVALAALLAAAVLASPLVPLALPSPAELRQRAPLISNSGYHRLLIWEFTAERIAERPLLGWGFNTSRSIPGRDAMLDRNEQALPLHPHNAALQWWLELGLAGAALAAGVLVWTLLTIRRAPVAAVPKAAAAGLVLSAVTVSCLSYGAWQSWWMAALWLTAGLMVPYLRAPAGAAEIRGGPP